LRGKLRRQGQPAHVLHAQRGDRDAGGDGRVNAAAQAQHRGFETALVQVVAQAERERVEYLLLLARRRQRDGRGGVQVHEQEILLKQPALRHRPALRVKDQAAAVEDQLVIAADGIAVKQRALRLGGQAGEHLVPHAILAEVPGRGGDIEDDAGTLAGEVQRGIARVTALPPEILVIPHVFADGEADLDAVELDRRVPGGRLEITVLIKHIVSGQQRFGARGDNAPVLEQGDGVGHLAAGAAFIAPHETNQQTRLSRGGGQLLQRLQVARHKRRALQEIARRVASDGQFWCHHDFRTRVATAPVGGEDAGDVAREIADGGVQLGQEDFHARDGFNVSGRRFP
jgi:hypothetical protein